MKLKTAELIAILGTSGMLAWDVVHRLSPAFSQAQGLHNLCPPSIPMVYLHLGLLTFFVVLYRKQSA